MYFWDIKNLFCLLFLLEQQYFSKQAFNESLNFCNQTIPQWNGLSPSVVNSQTTEEFKGTPHLVKTQPKDFSCLFFCLVLFCFFKIPNSHSLA